MKPTLETPSTCIIALWVAEGKAAATLLLRADSSDVTALPFVVANAQPWWVVARAAEYARDTDARHCLIVTNWEDAIKALNPFHLDEKAGPHHLEVMQILATRFAGRCTAMRAESMPKTEAMWKHCWS